MFLIPLIKIMLWLVATRYFIAWVSDKDNYKIIDGGVGNCRMPKEILKALTEGIEVSDRNKTMVTDQWAISGETGDAKTFGLNLTSLNLKNFREGLSINNKAYWKRKHSLTPETGSHSIMNYSKAITKKQTALYSLSSGTSVLRLTFSKNSEDLIPSLKTTGACIGLIFTFWFHFNFIQLLSVE